MGRRLAGTLARRGIGAGDVVAFQLPNWVEAVACFYGLLPLGVVVVPIVHIYGSKEMVHILRQSGARALITTDRFARQDYVANLEAGLSDLPDLELVIIVPADRRPDAEAGNDRAVLGRGIDGDPLDRPRRVDPDSPALVGYTSGTTAAPKGVIHTHRTFLADQRTWATFAGQDQAPAPARAADGTLDRVAGGPRHRAHVGVAAALRGQPGQPHGRLGPGHVLERHGQPRRRHRRWPALLPDQPARSTRTSTRPCTCPTWPG